MTATSPTDFTTMLNQAAAALADCMLNLTESTSQAASGQVNPVKLKASKAIYMTAQAALMQSRAVEASLRALAHLQKIQENHKPPEAQPDPERIWRQVQMFSLTDDADRTARINARVRLAAEAKYAQAKTDAEIDALGKVSLEVPELEQELAEAMVLVEEETEGGLSSPPHEPPPLCGTTAPGCDGSQAGKMPALPVCGPGTLAWDEDPKPGYEVTAADLTFMQRLHGTPVEQVEEAESAEVAHRTAAGQGNHDSRYPNPGQPSIGGSRPMESPPCLPA